MQYLHKIHQIKKLLIIAISGKNKIIILSRTQLVIVIETERIFAAQSNGRT